jgi:DNA modification methylase
MHIENGHYFPAYGYEDILVYGKKHPKFEVRDKSEIREWQINVWDVPSVSTNDEKSNEGHPAQFPVKIPYQLMKSYSMDHAIIYEPFNGSGSTLIACEMTNRKCYAIEIEPRYIDVAVKRWQNYTGKKGKNLTRPEVGIPKQEDNNR